MPTTVLSLQQKLFTGAQAYSPISSILASANYFRWYDSVLPQTPTINNLPAVVVQQINNPKDYSFTGRITTSWYLMQFTIWATPDSAAANAVAVVYCKARIK